MKDGIGQGKTRSDHNPLATQLYAAFAHVQDMRSLASVIGEEEMSSVDQKYLAFGRQFEQEFVHQAKEENRSIEETLQIGWTLLSMLPKGELTRVSEEELDKYYRKS